MSNMDYTKFTKPNKTKEAVVEPVEVQNGVEEKVEQISMVGTVAGCEKLNVRKSANKWAEVVCEIPVGSEVVIREDESTEEFYKVCTAAGAEGFCMREYIRTK